MTHSMVSATQMLERVRLSPDPPPGFREWVQHFEKKRAAKQAIRSLLDLRPYRPDDPIELLLSAVLEECYKAWLFQQGNDPWRDLRQEDKEILENLPPKQKSVTDLRDFFLNHPRAANWVGLFAKEILDDYGIKISIAKPGPNDALIAEISALEKSIEATVSALKSFEEKSPVYKQLSASVDELREKHAALTKILESRPECIQDSEQDNGSKKVEAPEFLDLLLRALHDAMGHSIPGVGAGPFIHRSQDGCLLYPTAIDAKCHKPDAAVNGLLFSLVFLFRRWTYKGPLDVIIGGAGASMPDKNIGLPCYPRAAMFVNAALDLDKDLTPGICKDRIRKLPSGVGLVKWPKVEF